MNAARNAFCAQLITLTTDNSGSLPLKLWHG